MGGSPEGFLNLRVGSRDRTLVVEYENTVFNHNELDALGLVAGLACQAAPEQFDTLRVVIKRRNIRTATRICGPGPRGRLSI